MYLNTLRKISSKFVLLLTILSQNNYIRWFLYYTTYSIYPELFPMQIIILVIQLYQNLSIYFKFSYTIAALKNLLLLLLNINLSESYYYFFDDDLYYFSLSLLNRLYETFHKLIFQGLSHFEHYKISLFLCITAHFYLWLRTSSLRSRSFIFTEYF